MNRRTIERVRAEFVAEQMSPTRLEDYKECNECGHPEGNEFTLQNIHEILDRLEATIILDAKG
jgi:hypothetical protein